VPSNALCKSSKWRLPAGSLGGCRVEGGGGGVVTRMDQRKPIKQTAAIHLQKGRAVGRQALVFRHLQAASHAPHHCYEM